jgi:hypothetical protein
MDSNNPSQSEVGFAGFVCFWNVPCRPGKSTRQRFFAIYGDLRQTVQQHSSGSNPTEHKCKWKMVRISEAGKKFLGLVRR